MSNRNSIESKIKSSTDTPNKLDQDEIICLNDIQYSYVLDMIRNPVVIGAGRAGTGKTYMSSVVAALLFKKDKSYKNIILTRPNVEAGEKLGALPGELMEKYEPYMQPFEKGLVTQLGSENFKKVLYQKILPQPLGYMRGKTFDDSIILCDEAQNMTIAQMKLLCTRIGTNSKLFITGDENQCDLNPRQVPENGLAWMIRQIREQNKPIPITQFSQEDCVRSDVCKMFLEMFENAK